MAQDHNDIYSIVERLAILEGRITPASVKHGLNKQQKSVPQLPALFKPKTEKILGGNPNAKNPMSGYMVGDDVDGFDGSSPELETEAALSGTDEDGDAPTSLGLPHRNHAITALHPDEKANFELIDDDNRLRRLEDFRRNGGLWRGLELLQDRQA